MNTNWVNWKNRNQLSKLDQPGVYYLAHSTKNFSKMSFEIIEDIIYIGMTISQRGLKGRFSQFSTSMNGTINRHGGGDRIYFRHKNSISKFLDNLYVSVQQFPVSKNRDLPSDWRMKGKCVKQEYVGFADYIDKFKQLPEFNDHKRSPKK